MTTWNKLKNQIKDVEEYITENKIKIIPLRKNAKFPEIRDYYNKKFSTKQLINHQGNLGICVGYNHEINGQSISVIDIDGYTDVSLPEEDREMVKKQTAEDVYNILKKIPGCMIVQSQSGGKHLYCWNKTTVDNIHQVSESLHFPLDYHIESLRGQSLNQTIEIFTKWQSKQCVLPGSSINGRNYQVISIIDCFDEIEVVDNIHETVKDYLVDAGYIYEEKQNDVEITSFKDLTELDDDSIGDIVSLLAPYFCKLIHLKNNSYLCLGGYLCKHVSMESTKKIVEGLLDATDDDYPKHIKTALSNYDRDVNKKGLKSLLENIRQACQITYEEAEGIRFRLERIVNSNFKHKILIKKISNTKKQFLELDFKNKVVNTYIRNINKDGEVFFTNEYTVMNMIPIEMYQTFNILDYNEIPQLHMKYIVNGMPRPQTITGKDIQSIDAQLKRIPGLLLQAQQSTNTVNLIIQEYIKLGLMPSIEDAPVAGVFINPNNNQLIRTDSDGKKEIVKPSVDAVSDALMIWQTLQSIYPGDSKKLSTILRWGLLAPFSYILKTQGKWMKCLYLYGASRTSKTTLGEISLSPYTLPTGETSIGGGAFDTAYRIGNALSRQGIGLVINEPMTVIENDDNIEIIKRAVENKYCREKQQDGIHIKIPSYCNMCFTSNSFAPSVDAFIRRAIILEFTAKERLTEEDIANFNNTFHYVNNENNDFKKLQGIGDFVIWYVSENIDILKEEHKNIVDTLLDELIKYTNHSKENFQWLYEEAETMEISDTDDDIITTFKDMILTQYRRYTISAIGVADKVAIELGKITTEDDAYEETDEKTKFKATIKVLIKENIYTYLRYHKLDTGLDKGIEHIYINASVKKALMNFDKESKITCSGLASRLDKEYKTYKIKNKHFKGFRVELDEFIDFLME